MYNLNKSIRLVAGLVLLIVHFHTVECSGQADAQDAKLLFETRYNLWRDWLTQHTPPSPSSIINMRDLYDNEPFREIVKLGVSAIPYMIEKQQEDHMLGYALYQITKWKWHTIREGKDPNEWIWTVEEFPDIREKHGPPDSRKLWLRWWKEGQKLTEQRFESLYREWEELKKQKKDEQAKNKYQRIIELGIAALPSIIQKIEQADTELIAAISELTDNKVNKTAKQSECLEWWKKNKDKWLITFPKPPADPNKPPAK